MAIPMFSPINRAAARLDITPGSSSHDAYYALVAQYHFGTPVIFGRAPAELAATIGVPLITGHDPGYLASLPCVVEVYFPYTQPTVVINNQAYPVSDAVGGGVIVGANYTSPIDGHFYPNVNWQWQISVEAFQQLSDSGRWQQQVVTWTGDGTIGRTIPTNFDLTVGNALVWVFPLDTNKQTAFRHSAMAGTFSAAGLDATHGIGLGMFGFTVTNDAFDNVDVNTLHTNYTALVLSDTTNDARYLQVGIYPGTADVSKSISPFNASVTETQVWIFGRTGTGVFCSSDFLAPNALSWANEAQTLTNQIEAIGTGGFTVGNNSNVNGLALPTYFWAAFSIPAGNAVRNLFQTFTGVGTGAPITIALNFTPAFAQAANFSAAGPVSTTWRGPWQTGLHSTSWVGAQIATDGIRALGANSVTIGVSSAPNAQHVYGFALASTGSVVLLPVVVPVAPPPGVGGSPLNYPVDVPVPGTGPGPGPGTGVGSCVPALAPALTYQTAPYPTDAAGCVPALVAAPSYQTAPYPNDMPSGGCA